MSGEGYCCKFCGDDMCPRGRDEIVSIYEGMDGTALVDQAWLNGLLNKVQCLERQVDQLKSRLAEVTHGDYDSYF